MGEGGGGQATALGQGEAPSLQGGRHLAVGVGRGDHGHARVVLGSGAHHGGAADVDLLDAGVEGGAGGHGAGEGVEVDHHQVDGGHAQLLQLAHVLGLAAVGQDTGVDAGVEGLDAALQALGEVGDLLHGGHGDARSCNGGGGRAGGDDLDARPAQGCGQVGQPRLVVDGDQGPAHGQTVGALQALGGHVRRRHLHRGGRCGGGLGTRAGLVGGLGGHELLLWYLRVGGTPRRATSPHGVWAAPRWCPTLASRGWRPLYPRRILLSLADCAMRAPAHRAEGTKRSRQ